MQLVAYNATYFLIEEESSSSATGKSTSKNLHGQKHKKKGKKSEHGASESDAGGHHRESHKKHKSKEGGRRDDQSSKIERSTAINEPTQTNAMSGLSQLAPATIRTTEGGGGGGTSAPKTDGGSAYRILQTTPTGAPSGQRQQSLTSQYPKDVLVRAKQQELNQPSTSGAGGYKIIKELKPYVPDTPSNREKVGAVPVPRAPLDGKLTTDHEKPQKMKKSAIAKKSSTKVSALNAGDLLGSSGKGKKSLISAKTATPKAAGQSNLASDAMKKFDNRSVSFIKEPTAPEVAAMTEPKKAEGPAVIGTPTAAGADVEKQLVKQGGDASGAAITPEKASRRRRKYYLACCLTLVALFALVMITVMIVQYGAAGKLEDSTTAMTSSAATDGDSTDSQSTSESYSDSEDDATTT
uniref:Uncharacterized protein n=1 Tax=Romanomermis culicivorax TaxID=13658 RepID=A0A915ISE5_ROMCU